MSPEIVSIYRDLKLPTCGLRAPPNPQVEYLIKALNPVIMPIHTKGIFHPMGEVWFCLKLCYHMTQRHYQVPNLWFEGRPNPQPDEFESRYIPSISGLMQLWLFTKRVKIRLNEKYCYYCSQICGKNKLHPSGLLKEEGLSYV
jgi:hypothetical protein